MGDLVAETSSVPPEWLEKLEKRREIVSKGRLGHESGAGAPCNVCGEIIIVNLLFNSPDHSLFLGYRRCVSGTGPALLEKGLPQLQVQERSA